MCASCIDIASLPYFYYMLKLLQQCSIFCLFVSYVGTVPTVWYFCLFLSYVGSVPTMWYFLLIFIICWNCSNSVVFFVYFYHMLELSQQCGIFVYFYHMLEPFQSCGIFSFSLDQYVVIKHRNSIKLIPLHIRINRSNPPHFTACANPFISATNAICCCLFVFGVFSFWFGRSMS